MLLSEIKKIFHKELDPIYPAEEVDHFFYRLMEHHLGLERFVLVLDPSVTLTKEEEQPLFEGLADLKLEKPIQYILEEAYFMDLPFKVNSTVLIPRPETEELVRWIISDYQKPERALSVLDIGTGSGCIAIALAKFLPSARLTAIDISEDALSLAQHNATRLEAAINFVGADITQEIELEETYDIIVSNPPYVRISEKKDMRNNVKKYEPHQALFVPDEHPLLFYEKIAELASRKLKAGGGLYLEINQYLAEETKELLASYDFSQIELSKDLFGNFRMLKAICKPQN